MNIQAEKALIIEQFRQINDVNLIHTIKSMLDYALKKEQEHFDEAKFTKNQQEFVEGTKKSLEQVEQHLKGEIKLKSADQLFDEL